MIRITYIDISLVVMDSWIQVLIFVLSVLLCALNSYAKVTSVHLHV